MTLEKFLNQPYAEKLNLITNTQNTEDILIEYISTLEPPVESFVRKNELILSTAMSLQDNSDCFLSFITDLKNAGAAGLVYAQSYNDFTVLESILPQINELNFPVITATWDVLFSTLVEDTIKLIWQSDNDTHTYTEEIQRDLLNCFIKGKTLDDAAEILYKKLKSDVIILDYNHKILGRNVSIRTLSPRGFLESRTNELSKIVISAYEKVYGYVLIDSTQYYEKINQKSLVQYISTPLTLWFDREYSILASKMKSREEFVWRLAQHNFTSKNEILQQATYLDFNTDSKYACIVASINHNNYSGHYRSPYANSFSSTIIEEQILETANRYNLSSMTSLNKDTLIIFLECKNMSTFQTTAEEYISELEQFFNITLPNITFIWGYDAQQYSIADLYIGYGNAQEALSICLESGGLLSRSCYQLSALQKITSTLKDNVELVALSNNILGPLIQLDKEKRTDYIDTLTEYLNSNYNISEAARACHLHRQSFIYRINKIEELCGLSLSNHNDLLLLDLAIRIYSR